MPQARSFKIGDIVKLKSGGPRMTIEEIGTPLGIKCQWFAGAKLSEGWFDPQTLEPATEE